MAVAVTDGERTLASRSYGVPDGTMFQFGSIGKSFTAIVALQLAERGLLDLHAPVTDVLPWFAVGGTTAPITLHHLLTHSSGLIQGAEIATGSNYDVVALADTEVGFAPGEHFWYSNVGYRVIGWMLERVSGHGYPRLVSRADPGAAGHGRIGALDRAGDAAAAGPGDRAGLRRPALAARARAGAGHLDRQRRGRRLHLLERGRPRDLPAGADDPRRAAVVGRELGGDAGAARRGRPGRETADTTATGSRSARRTSATAAA